LLMLLNAGQKIKVHNQQATLFDAISHSRVRISVVEVFSPFPKRLRKNSFQVKRPHNSCARALGGLPHAAPRLIPPACTTAARAGDPGFHPSRAKAIVLYCPI
jgi:hypothetical protein